jgi:hypothetical protein
VLSVGRKGGCGKRREKERDEKLKKK